MRKVTELSALAFLGGETKKVNNTEVKNDAMFLFGNKIAEYRADGLYITAAGWKTATTKERLNSLPNVSIYQSKGIWYLNGIEWSGEWTKVLTFKIND